MRCVAFRVLELLSCSSPQVIESSNRLASLFGGEPEQASESVLLRGESVSPFIVKGDGLISRRKREWIRVLPSLVAHAVGYETVIGAHNIIYVRRLWQAIPCSPSTANIGAYNIL